MDAELRNFNSSSQWLNLGFYTLMSQSASQTLRSTANEAEFYITRYGEMKTASGGLAIASGILGIIGLILSPFGGVALTTTAIGLGMASAMTGVPSAVLEITNTHINRSPDYYARIANNQMRMVQNQGRFIKDFLDQAIHFMEADFDQLTPQDIDEIEKFLYIFEIYNFYKDSELQDKSGMSKKLVKSYTATKGILASLANAHELGVIRQGYVNFMDALDDPTTIKRNKAKDFVYHIFPQEFDWEKEMAKHFQKIPHQDFDADWDSTSRSEILDDLSKDPYRNKKQAKTRLNRKVYKPNVKVPLWTRNIAKSILPQSVYNWGKSHAKIVKGLFYGLSGVLDSLTIGFGIYDVIVGSQNLQGSGTITDRLKDQANLIDTSLLGILSLYEDLTNTSTADLISTTLHDQDLLTGIELHTCNQYWGGSTYGIQGGLSSGKSSCKTQDLMNYQIMHRGEWMDYNGLVLGNCSHFPLEDKLEMHLQNHGTDAMCLEDVNLKTNFNAAPKFYCHVNDEKSMWIASDYDYENPPDGYTNRHDMKCSIIPGIAQLRIIVPNVNRAGTDGTIRVKFSFQNGKSCTSAVLDNKHNDFMTNSDNVFQANTLGECFQMRVSEDDLKLDVNRRPYVDLEAINEGSDGLSMSAIEFHLNLNEESQRFKCSLPPHGIRIDYSSEKYN